jgi:hypothetical protein
VALQKMLCMNYLVFFKMIEFCCENELSETDLNYVLSLALRNNKKTSEYEKLVKTIFNKLESINRGVKKIRLASLSFLKFLFIKTNDFAKYKNSVRI